MKTLIASHCIAPLPFCNITRKTESSLARECLAKHYCHLKQNTLFLCPMFDLTPRTITYGKASLTYASIPWDSLYLSNTTIEIKKFSFQTTREAQNLLATLKQDLRLSKGDLLFYKTSPLEIASICFSFHLLF